MFVARTADTILPPKAFRSRGAHLLGSMATAVANGSAKPLVLYDLAPEPGICPYVHRAKITLKDKGIPYEQRLIDAANKPKEFLDLFRDITSNPAGRGTVPTIIDGDVKLTESHVVSEYLDTAYADKGIKFFPTDAKKLALVRLFVELYTVHVQPAGARIQTSTTLEELDKAKQDFVHGLKIIDKFLGQHGQKNGPWLLGDEFSYAEAATLPFLYRASRFLPAYRKISVEGLIDENKLEHLAKWSQTGFERPSVKDTAPPDDLIVKLGKKRVTVAYEDLK